MVVKITPSRITPKQQAVIIALLCLALVIKISHSRAQVEKPLMKGYIPPQTAWRTLSRHKAPQCLDVIEQEHADRIDWDFIDSVADKRNPASYLRYNSTVRISMPHASTDPRTTPSKVSASTFKHRRVAFINGHHGTSDDFRYMAHQFGLPYAEFNPRAFWYYGANASATDAININGNLGEFFCKSFDTVVVGDTIPDSRFLLQWIDAQFPPECGREGAAKCGTCGIRKIMMMTTNRFDFAVKKEDLGAYHSLVMRVTKLGDLPGARSRGIPKIIWLANNPFDIEYVKVALGENFKFTLIRSFGYSTLPPVKAFAEQITHLPAVFNHYDESKFIGWLMRNDIEVAVLKRNYGGPTALSQFRAFIDFPYQASTMKMYENMLFGVVTLVPSKRLFLELEGYIIEGDRVPGWQDFVEYWYKDLADYVYTFDSIGDLKEMLSSEVLDIRNIREFGEGIWKQWNQKSLGHWHRILKEEQ